MYKWKARKDPEGPERSGRPGTSGISGISGSLRKRPVRAAPENPEPPENPKRKQPRTQIYAFCPKTTGSAPIYLPCHRAFTHEMPHAPALQTAKHTRPAPKIRIPAFPSGTGRRPLRNLRNPRNRPARAAPPPPHPLRQPPRAAYSPFAIPYITFQGVIHLF